MKYGMVVVLLIASATAQDKLTAKQCRADLGKWVPMFKATYAAAECQGDGRPNCPFVDPIRTLQSAQLVNIATEAEECIKLDSKKKNHFYYERVATRAENIMVMRMANFLAATDQGSKYELWEAKRRAAMSTREKRAMLTTRRESLPLPKRP
jgi:hypothetical protein